MPANRNSLVAKFNQLFNALAAKQELFLAQTGEYCQILDQDVIPDGENEVDMDHGRAPSDRPWTAQHLWREVEIEEPTDENDSRSRSERARYRKGPSEMGALARLRSSVSIQVRQGPSGWDWGARMKYKDAGTGEIHYFERWRDDADGVWKTEEAAEV